MVPYEVKTWWLIKSKHHVYWRLRLEFHLFCCEYWNVNCVQNGILSFVSATRFVYVCKIFWHSIFIDFSLCTLSPTLNVENTSYNHFIPFLSFTGRFLCLSTPILFNPLLEEWGVSYPSPGHLFKNECNRTSGIWTCLFRGRSSLL